MVDAIGRTQQAMAKQDYEAIVVAGASNVFYLTDFAVTPIAVNPILDALAHLYPIVVLVPVQGHLVIFADESLKQYADDLNLQADLRYYPSGLFLEYAPGVSRPAIYADSLQACIVRYFTETPPKYGKIGYDRAFSINPGLELLEGLNISSVDHLLTMQRACKTPEEIRRIRIASKVAYEAMDLAESLLNDGTAWKEDDLFYEMRRHIFDSRCQWRFTTLSAGEYSADIYHQPTDYRLKTGDVVRLDLGPVYRGYCSDIARTFFFKEIPTEYGKLYEVLSEAQRRMVAEMKSGVVLSDLFNLGYEYVCSHGYPSYQRGHLGHSIGVESTEAPLINPEYDCKAEEGMIFSIEVPYYIKDRAGFNMEDIVLVHKDSCEILRGD